MKVQFDADMMVLQMFHPSIHIRVWDTKTDVLLASGAVGGQIDSFACLSGIEEEEHGVAASQEDMPWKFRGEEFQAEQVLIKGLRRFEIVHVDGGFENTLDFHGDEAGIHFCNGWTSTKLRPQCARVKTA
jgi:hypothetical protein